ncbi:MAG TPA: multidrug transporter MatE [Candidatus Onthovicinus excrementipullorum]|nr:multidrug transporter MatE [Candidatus Onthovicinus excrementipullorum]
MNLLTGKIGKLYFKYLSAAFGSALITSIYGLVDMAMVGQYQGPDGTAALAVFAPVWNILYSLGLLTGIGGSILFSSIRGRNGRSGREENEYFTTALIGTAVFSVLSWIGLIFFDAPLLRLFGAEETLLPLAQAYLKPIRFVIPTFLFTQMLAAFLRNDGAPGLATAAVLTGGIFNVFGDYFCVFTLDMGIEGAGLATAIGSMLSLIVMLSHFFSRKNTLRPVRIRSFFKKSREIAVTGFSTFFIDIAMGILTMMFNRQIMQYLGTDALSVYGVIVNISTFVQCCAYSVGQAAQPIISANYGAQKYDRIRGTLKYSLAATTFFALLWTALALACPTMFIYIFMDPTATVLQIAPGIIRCYGLSFLLLPLNIFSTYYFQSLMKPRSAFFISVARGLVLSGILIYVLPLLGGGEFIWFAMPITELIVSAAVIWMMVRYTHALRPDIV